MSPSIRSTEILTAIGTKGRTLIIAGLLGLCFGILGSCLINDTMIYNPDSVHYLAWAHSLSSLDGYRIALGPEPFRYVFNAPLYPVLLVPAALLFPWSVVAAKALTLTVGVILLVAFFLFVAERTTRAVGCGALVFLAINPLFQLYATQILSDIPFALCLVLFLILTPRVLTENRLAIHAAFIAVIVAALLLRELGFALLFAGALTLWKGKHWRALLSLLIVALLVYGLWFIRNEAIVGTAENPSLRNTRLFFSHVYTESDRPLPAEFAARLASGLKFYGAALGGLLVAPFDAEWSYSLSRTTATNYATVNNLLPGLRIPLGVLTLGVCLIGAWRVFRTYPPLVMTALLLLYGGIILLYPVVDIRFVFPFVVIMLWFAAECWMELASRLGARFLNARRAIMLILLCALALPNLLWVENAVSTNLSYRAHPAAFSDTIRRAGEDPNELTLVRRPAAEWIAAHTPERTVVGSRFKDAGIWLGGRPVLSLSPFMTEEEFDQHLRDYGVTYLLCSLIAHKIPDLDAQMAVSDHWRFQQVFAQADIAVFAVSPKGNNREASLRLSVSDTGSIRRRFLEGIVALKRGSSGAAAVIFQNMRQVHGLEVLALFYAAVAEECASNLDEAAELFRQFRTIPQAAGAMVQVLPHEEIIALLREAELAQLPEDRALLYHSASLSYWALGLRAQAILMLRQCLAASPDLFVGNIFGAIYALEVGDTTGARNFVSRAAHDHPEESLSHAMQKIMTLIDSLPRAHPKGAVELAIGREFFEVGLYEFSIDQAWKALSTEENAEALRLLVDAYVKKDRRGPALAALRRLAVLEPENRSVLAEIRQLSR